MPILKPPAENPKIDEAIDNLLTELNEYPGYDENTKKIVNVVEKLHKLKHQKREPVKLDTALMVAGNVVVAAMIIAFEQKHVITSKVGTFLTKLR